MKLHALITIFLMSNYANAMDWFLCCWNRNNAINSYYQQYVSFDALQCKDGYIAPEDYPMLRIGLKDYERLLTISPEWQPKHKELLKISYHFQNEKTFADFCEQYTKQELDRFAQELNDGIEKGMLSIRNESNFNFFEIAIECHYHRAIKLLIMKGYHDKDGKILTNALTPYRYYHATGIYLKNNGIKKLYRIFDKTSQRNYISICDLLLATGSKKDDFLMNSLWTCIPPFSQWDRKDDNKSTQLMENIFASSSFDINSIKNDDNQTMLDYIIDQARYTIYPSSYSSALRLLLYNGINPHVLNQDSLQALSRINITYGDKVLLALAWHAHAQQITTHLQEKNIPSFLQVKENEFHGTQEDYEQLEYDKKLLSIGLIYYFQRLDLLEQTYNQDYQTAIAHKKFRSAINSYPGDTTSFKKNAMMLMKLRKSEISTLTNMKFHFC
jgi:hypothetical protein